MLGTPSRAFAQTSSAPGTSVQSFPDESAPPKAPAATPAPNPAQPPSPPPPEPAAAPPPAAQPSQPSTEPLPSEPRYPVTFDAVDVASLTIRGPGIDKPLTCSGTCTFRLVEGVYWVDINASGRLHTVTVNVTGPVRVVIEGANAGVRGLGIGTIILGGVVAGGAFWISYSIALNCGQNGPYEGTAQCRRDEQALPYLVAAMGVGAVVSVVGILIFIGNNKPSLEIVQPLDNRARRAPGTFIGLGPVEGSTLPGLSLKTSF